MDRGLDRTRTSLIGINPLGVIATAIPLVFLVVFFFMPVFHIFCISMTCDSEITTSGLVEIATSSYYWETLAFTLLQALLSTLLTLGLALPVAYITAHYNFAGKSTILAIITLPFMLPTIIIAVAFSTLMGQQGLLNQWLMSIFFLDAPPIQLERTFAIIVIAHIFYNFALAVRMISNYWSQLPLRFTEAAKALGASKIQLIWELWLPMLRPILLSAGLLIFIFNFTSFGVVLVLGGLQHATLEVEIYRQAANLYDLPTASALSLVQLLFVFALMITYERIRPPTSNVTTEQFKPHPTRLKQKLLVYGTMAIPLVIIATPLVALAWRSLVFTADTPLLQNYALLMTQSHRSVLNAPAIYSLISSIGNALAATSIALFIGLSLAYAIAQTKTLLSRSLEVMIMLPLAASAVILGFGYNIALDEPPLNLRTSPLLIPIAQSIIAIPFVMRSIVPTIRNMPKNISQAAQILGANQQQVFRTITLPILKNSLIIAAVFAFTVSIGEFGASLFLARPNLPTATQAIFRLLSQPGAASVGQVMALSTLLMLTCVLAFLIIERLRTSESGAL
jgi:thiamine transport system permease protein